MKVAELLITQATYAMQPTTHVVSFASLEEAKKKFDEIAALLKRRADRENDLPKWLEIKAINELTCDFGSICAISLVDLAHADEQQKGVRDAFPHLGWNK